MNKNIPNHVAIIMDGNGRWATNKGLSRSDGHLAGSKTLKKLTKHIFKRGIKVLSVFAFSTENFKRNKDEVDYLMNLFVKMFKSNFEYLKKNDIKIVFSKKENGLLQKLENVIYELEENTKLNASGIFNICLNYGGQDEIIDVTKKIALKVKNNTLEISDINKNLIEETLYQSLPPIDLLIRTSGEYRISNFMLWQLAYSEMYFTNTYFPDFDDKEFDKALKFYTTRNRRFGNIK